MSMSFQDVILSLQDFWAKQGCVVVQPYDTEKGAGTFNPSTFLRSLGPEPWNTAYVEPCRRPQKLRSTPWPNTHSRIFTPPAPATGTTMLR